MSRRARASALARWRRRSPAERRLLLEAVLLIVVARLAIVLLPFRRLAMMIGAPRSGAEMPPQDIERLRWAIRAVARRMPFRALCFEQGLTAHVMLRRRGVASTLYYGVGRNEGDTLIAHVWVRSGPRDVIGTEGCERFTVVATFPNQSQAPTATSA